MNYGMMVSLGVLLLSQVAHALGWIDDATYQAFITTAGAGGAGSLAQQLSSNNKQSATRTAVLAQAAGVNQEAILTAITEPAKAPLPKVEVPPTAASNPVV